MDKGKMIKNVAAAWFAISLSYHASNIYEKRGIMAALLAVVFMLAFGEVLRTWIKMIKSRLKEP